VSGWVFGTISATGLSVRPELLGGSMAVGEHTA
jgi:hypothetical protein